MLIASWNVNSIRLRFPQVLGWLEVVSPDVLLLQEIKCRTEIFPCTEWNACGYPYYEVVGQKGYNGVAMVSKYRLSDVVTLLPGRHGLAPQARYIEAKVEGVRIICVYVPNGNPVGGEGYRYKLRWLGALIEYVAEILQSDDLPFVLGGDFNVIPTVEDVYDAQEWRGDALFVREVRGVFRRLLFLGLSDAYRVYNRDKETSPYTFWDYQKNRWTLDQGLRIDHFLLSPRATDRLMECTIDRTPRGFGRPSDHTPILVSLTERDPIPCMLGKF